MKDCGCGGGKNCITKTMAEQLLGSFVRNNPSLNRKSKRATLALIRKELKRLDCGCGCNGKNKFAQLYLKGGKLDDCPPGWRNDGLTCVEPCASDEFDDGLTCRKKCPPGQIDDGLTCRVPIESSMDPCPEGSRDVAGTCWGKVREDCADDCINKPAPGCRTYECGRLRGLFGEDWGPKLCTDCNLRCGQSCWAVDGITRGLAERNLKTWGGEVYGQAIRGKRITGRINWDATLSEVTNGFKEFASHIDFSALDPEKNGVGDAFRKFGENTQAAFEDIGRKMEKAFDPNQNGVAQAFADFAKQAEANLEQFGQDFVAKCKDPDTWVQVITIMAQVAGAVLAAAITVGTLGAGTGLAIGLGMALNAVGPAVKMIADAAQGRPVDALDIAQLAIAIIPPVPGAGTVMGEGVRKAIQYGNYAAQAGKVIVAGVQAGQMLGVVDSTCIANCPPPAEIPPDIPFEEPPAGDEEILAKRPEENSYAYIYTGPTSRRKNPNFISDDAWIAKWKAEHPVAAPPAPLVSTPGEEEEEPDFGDLGAPVLEDDEEPDFSNIGGPVLEDDEEPDFSNIGGPVLEDDEEPDFSNIGAPVLEGEEEPDFSNVGEPVLEDYEEPDFSNIEAPLIEEEEPEFGDIGAPVIEEEMTADEFLGRVPPASTKFLEQATPPPLPPATISQIISKVSVPVAENPTPPRRTEFRVSSTPALPMPAATKIIIPSIPRGKYLTPKDVGYYLKGAGRSRQLTYADMLSMM